VFGSSTEAVEVDARKGCRKSTITTGDGQLAFHKPSNIKRAWNHELMKWNFWLT
jgi:hypothetical protein